MVPEWNMDHCIQSNQCALVCPHAAIRPVLLTQLFGERMVIGNATGCSSIWGGYAPPIPYCTNRDGFGPTWGNSLFEDPAEFSYGMLIGALQQRSKLANLVRKALSGDVPQNLTYAMQGWLAGMNNAARSKKYGDINKTLLPEFSGHRLLCEIERRSNLFTRKSFWVFAGDGAAYDIAFLAASIMCWLQVKISMSLFSTPKFILIPVDSLPKQPPPDLWPSLLHPARKHLKKI